VVVVVVAVVVVAAAATHDCNISVHFKVKHSSKCQLITFIGRSMPQAA
jgi:hypothetical protein